jgi:3'(2'), 5'-bisphosphate nucleotidase
MGSSLKFMVLAEGNADVYPRFAPTMEWDTAAADAVLRSLGYSVFKVSENTEISQSSIDYNKENLLNPYFIAY